MIFKVERGKHFDRRFYKEFLCLFRTKSISLFSWVQGKHFHHFSKHLSPLLWQVKVLDFGRERFYGNRPSDVFKITMLFPRKPVEATKSFHSQPSRR